MVGSETPHSKSYLMVRNRRQIIHSLLSFLGFLFLSASEALGFEALCTRAIAGGAMVVRMPDGKNEKVRLIGVDTSEIKKAKSPRQYFGKRPPPSLNP
jgi:endonuclease YncB( thermonuclease family)